MAPLTSKTIGLTAMMVGCFGLGALNIWVLVYLLRERNAIEVQMARILTAKAWAELYEIQNRQRRF